jgi:putative transposase
MTATAPMVRARIHARLTLKLKIPCSKKRVARLMYEEGLFGVDRRKNVGCTKRDPARPVYPDLVRRSFTATEPNQLWVADITQHYTSEGWFYLAVIIDLFSRIIAGWSMGERPVTDLVVNALNMAVWNRQPGDGLIHHLRPWSTIYLISLQQPSTRNRHYWFDGYSRRCPGQCCCGKLLCDITN